MTDDTRHCEDCGAPGARAFNLGQLRWLLCPACEATLQKLHDAVCRPVPPGAGKGR